MRSLLMILMGVCLSLSLFARDFQFVYIRFDNSMSKSQLLQTITNLKNTFSDSEEFIIYYSNAQIIMDARSWNEADLYGIIMEQMSYSAISIPDETEKISELLEKYLKLNFEGQGINKKVLSQENFSTIKFNLLVGSEFVFSKNPNGLLARVFITNSLNKSNIDLNLCYYPCGSVYTENDLQFNSLYQLNNVKLQIVK
jgi:hypothetical protein